MKILGREGDPWSEEVEEVFTEVPSISVNEGCDSQTGLSELEVAFADGMSLSFNLFHRGVEGLSPKFRVRGRTSVVH